MNKVSINNLRYQIVIAILLQLIAILKKEKIKEDYKLTLS